MEILNNTFRLLGNVDNRDFRMLNRALRVIPVLRKTYGILCPNRRNFYEILLKYVNHGLKEEELKVLLADNLQKLIEKSPDPKEEIVEPIEEEQTEKKKETGDAEKKVEKDEKDVKKDEKDVKKDEKDVKKDEKDETDEKKEDVEETKPKPKEVELPPVSVFQAESELFLSLIILILLLDEGEVDRAITLSELLVKVIQVLKVGRRSVDAFVAKIYFYYSRACEINGDVYSIRAELLKAYRVACLNRDFSGQAMLLNLILRNYLHYDHYDLAYKFVSYYPEEARSNAQYARFLYYLGRIKAIRLEYTDAHAKLSQAIRKAPQGTRTAIGFRASATKLSVLVELLLGEIPLKQTFMLPELKETLKPYFDITQAVRIGDIHTFQNLMKTHEQLFEKEKTLSFIHRLRHNVIKTGLRAINLSYSKISLEDICKRLGFETMEDCANVLSKAISDGIIDSIIDYDTMSLNSCEEKKLYLTNEPIQILHKRINFALQLYNDSIRAFQYIVSK